MLQLGCRKRKEKTGGPSCFVLTEGASETEGAPGTSVMLGRWADDRAKVWQDRCARCGAQSDNRTQGQDASSFYQQGATAYQQVRFGFAFDAAKMCRSGRLFGSSSRLPAERTMDSLSSRSEGTGEPQRRQKRVR